MIKKLILLPIFFFLIASNVTAAANRFIPFQARLTDGDGLPLNGVYKLIFIIYDEPTGGTAMWTEDHQDVSVINGMVNVILGTKSNLDDPDGNGSNQSVYFTENRYLGITVGTSSNQEMVPRHQIVPSFQAKIADRAFSADRALEANNADRLNNQLPAFYATKTSVDNVSSDLNQKIVDANSLVFTNATNIRNAVPAGTIMAYMGSSVPTGYLLANGDYKNVADFPDLFAAIGTMYGSSVNQFRLPDLQGQFLRGWANGSGNDPDRASRTNRGDGTAGDNIGTKQNDAMQRITGNFWISGLGNLAYPSSRTGAFSNINSSGYSSTHFNGTQGARVYFDSAASISPNPAKTSSYETRSKNISVMYIIKY